MHKKISPLCGGEIIEFENDYVKSVHFTHPESPAPITGPRKDDGSKPKMHLLNSHHITDIAKVMTFGAEKYGEKNYYGVPLERYFSAAMRHLLAYHAGEMYDQESGISHLAHVSANMMIMQAIIRSNDVNNGSI
jgi:hypothetical protein